MTDRQTDDRQTTDRRDTVPKARPIVRSAKNWLVCRMLAGGSRVSGVRVSARVRARVRAKF